MFKCISEHDAVHLICMHSRRNCACKWVTEGKNANCYLCLKLPDWDAQPGELFIQIRNAITHTFNEHNCMAELYENQSI